MGFLDIFSTQKQEDTFANRLHKKVSILLPLADENELTLVACVAGLLARVAYIDFEIHEGEVEVMRTTLKKWSQLPDLDIEAIVSLALDEIKDLSGLENHKYCAPLNNILSENQRYAILQSLFAVAAGDGRVEHNESEEIRVVAHGLLLEHPQYIAARATVLEKLAALKND